MKIQFRKMLAIVVAALACGQSAQPAEPDKQIPAEIVAMLKEHLGSWRSEGWIVKDGVKQPIAATWECKPAASGVGNVCTWFHDWTDRPDDSAIEIMGYDPQKKSLSITRVTDAGLVQPAVYPVVDPSGKTMTVKWSWAADGKKSEGSNHIVVGKPGEWTMLMTIETDGKRVFEMDVRHHRVKKLT